MTIIKRFHSKRIMNVFTIEARSSLQINNYTCSASPTCFVWPVQQEDVRYRVCLDRHEFDDGTVLEFNLVLVYVHLLCILFL